MKRPEIDFRNPDYDAVIRWRIETLRKIRDSNEGPMLLAVLRAHYKNAPWDFVRDWGVTYDPRLIGSPAGAYIPFIPFPRQIEMMQWISDHWRGGKDGVVPKSRDTGASWVSMAWACSMCLHWPGMAIGFGSRKEEYVDRLDSPKSLFFKARLFLANLPRELRGGWDPKVNGAFMRLTFPQSGSVITGEAGDNIGRGDRSGVYFVDESAHLERPQLAEASLAATTNCRIDMSSVNGMDNPFAEKVHSWPAEDVFYFHWRDDPRKDDAWYEAQKAKKDPVVIAQEYDISFTASVSGVVIPHEWLQACVDAHVALGITPSGVKVGGLDVADEGPDLNGFAGRYGILLEYVDEWSGKGSDIYATVETAHDICRDEAYDGYRYDADGLGAGVKGDARKINSERGTKLEVTPHRGSGAVLKPDDKIDEIDDEADDRERDKTQRTNKDYFANFKAQAWWALRLRVQRTYRAVKHGHPVIDPDQLISISSAIPGIPKLLAELSQATYSQNGAGKLLINKKPDGSKSPNKADAVVIAYAPAEPKRRGFFD